MKTSPISEFAKSTDRYREKSKVSYRELTKELKNILEEQYRGIIELNFEIGEAEEINISTSALACFFKLLLKYVNLGDYLRVYIKTENKTFNISIKKSPEIHFSDEETAALMRVAKSAGFYISIQDEIIALGTDILLSKNQIFAIYALDSKTIKGILQKILSEK